ncbi:MAG: hypothetical protein C4523_00985 [Myxococcales bacterium]|nr:MAG: hypothetical protein C4523_00985 [Myxococcales bacterium]
MRSIAKDGLLVLGLAVLAFMIAACQPRPESPPSSLSVEEHDTTKFPTDHGAAENTPMDCNKCHGGFDSFSEFTCFNCHRHEEALTRETHDGVPEFVYDSPTCLECHPMGRLGDIDHSRHFPIDDGSEHGDLSCKDCHNGETYGDFTCIDCHAHAREEMGGEHESVDGYMWDSNWCLACHPNGSGDDGLRHTFFPIGPEATHNQQTCTECHPEGPGAFTCVACHAHGQPGMSDAHQGVPGYAYVSSKCLECHPNGEGLDRESHDRFPIGSGSNHGEIACQSCHPDGSDSFSCLTCHNHAREETDPDHIAVPDYQYDSLLCLECHPDGEVQGREDHLDFPIRAGSSHGDVRCLECHPDGSESFACTNCHEHRQDEMEGAHQGVDGYRWDSPACLACHPQSEEEGLRHTFFPIGPESTHQDQSCRECHPDGQDTFTCTDCHEHGRTETDSHHQGLPGYAYNSPKCLTCHPDGEVVGRENHPYFPITEGEAHGEAACNNCHPSTVSEFTCTDCHDHARVTADAEHQEVAGYRYDSPWCLACHPDSDPEGLRHETFFPIDSEAVHKEQTCAECHPDGFDSFTCTQCHKHAEGETDEQHNEVAGYVYESPQCLACHPDGRTLDRLDHEDNFPIGPETAHAETPCTGCHPNGQITFTCTACHDHEQAVMAVKHPDVPDYGWETTQCRTCHPRGEAMDRTEHLVYFPVSAETAHGETTCDGCHTNGYDDFTCTACHDHDQPTMADKHPNMEDYDWISPQCRQCHPTGEAMSRAEHLVKFPIDMETPHGETACTACHPDGMNDFTCTSCHDHEQPTMADKHPNVPDYVWETAQCRICHPSGEAMDRTEHLVHFPVSAETAHGETSCVGCHPSGTDDFTCTACHDHDQPTMADKHATVADYSWVSAQCRQCHPTGEAMSRTEHAANFPVATGTPHGTTACAACHPNGYDDFTCTACHDHDQPTMATEHTGVNGYAWTSSECLACHLDGLVMTRERHTMFPIVSGHHSRYSCSDCHQAAGTYQSFSCTECHDDNEHSCIRMNEKHKERPDYACENARCLACHPNGRSDG